MVNYLDAKFDSLVVVLKNGYEVLNVCPHPVTVGHEGPDRLVFRGVGKENAFRLPTESVTEDFGGLPLGVTKVVDVEALPQAKEGRLYIVPSMVRQLFPNRKDFVSPTTDNRCIVKNDQGFTDYVLKLDRN